jgi:hypothetical protein
MHAHVSFLLCTLHSTRALFCPIAHTYTHIHTHTHWHTHKHTHTHMHTHRCTCTCTHTSIQRMHINIHLGACLQVTYSDLPTCACAQAPAAEIERSPPGRGRRTWSLRAREAMRGGSSNVSALRSPHCACMCASRAAGSTISSRSLAEVRYRPKNVRAAEPWPRTPSA